MCNVESDNNIMLIILSLVPRLYYVEKDLISTVLVVHVLNFCKTLHNYNIPDILYQVYREVRQSKDTDAASAPGPLECGEWSGIHCLHNRALI